jgi:hypothetical protein
MIEIQSSPNLSPFEQGPERHVGLVMIEMQLSPQGGHGGRVMIEIKSSPQALPVSVQAPF